MSGDVEAMAKVIHGATPFCLHAEELHFCESWARIILASDWLARHDAEVGAAALEAAAKRIRYVTTEHACWLREQAAALRADSLTATGELGGER